MEESLRRCLRVLRIVHELHKRGYQLARIMPGLSPSGLHWRCTITPRSNILRRHGAMCWQFKKNTVLYTSAGGNEYFGWPDAQDYTVRQLADRFIERYPEIAKAAYGDDWRYAGWYVKMLGYAER